jgi:hypothetical protein
MIAREMLHVVVRMTSRNVWRDRPDALRSVQVRGVTASKVA